MGTPYNYPIFLHIRKNWGQDRVSPFIYSLENKPLDA